MRLTKAKTIAVTALAVAGIATSGQALARVAPPEADAAAAAALAERVRVAPPEADAATAVALARTGTIVRPGAAPEAAPAPITVTPGGFDLGDAAIGAGFALGLVLLLVLGIKAVRGRRPLAH